MLNSNDTLARSALVEMELLTRPYRRNLTDPTWYFWRAVQLLMYAAWPAIPTGTDQATPTAGCRRACGSRVEKRLLLARLSKYPDPYRQTRISSRYGHDTKALEDHGPHRLMWNRAIRVFRLWESSASPILEALSFEFWRVAREMEAAALKTLGDRAKGSKLPFTFRLPPVLSRSVHREVL